jgi:hypothetical protein
MSEELRKELEQLRKAVEDEGPQPSYHRAVVRDVELRWPTLMTAVRRVLKAERKAE